MRELGRLPESEAVLRHASGRFPTRRELLIDLAWSVTHQHRHDDAIALWEQGRGGVPDHVGGFNGAAGARAQPGEAGAVGTMRSRGVACAKACRIGSTECSGDSRKRVMLGSVIVSGLP